MFTDIVWAEAGRTTAQVGVVSAVNLAELNENVSILETRLELVHHLDCNALRTQLCDILRCRKGRSQSDVCSVQSTPRIQANAFKTS